jgi:hypothetical protein
MSSRRLLGTRHLFVLGLAFTVVTILGLALGSLVNGSGPLSCIPLPVRSGLDTALALVAVASVLMAVGLASSRLVECYWLSRAGAGRLGAPPPWYAFLPAIVLASICLASCALALDAAGLLVVAGRSPSSPGFVPALLGRALALAAGFACGLVAGIRIGEGLARGPRP